MAQNLEPNVLQEVPKIINMELTNSELGSKHPLVLRDHFVTKHGCLKQVPLYEDYAGIGLLNCCSMQLEVSLILPCAIFAF